MTPRSTIRDIPQSDRYFSVDLGADLGDFEFRFPSYGKAARMVGLLQGLQEGDGLDRLVGVLDVAGYAIGACWFNRGFDLAAGDAPIAINGNGWREYGDAVIDELQEHGVKLPGVMLLVNTLINELGSRMSESAEAEEQAGN
jgi:hypothetical protein